MTRFASADSKELSEFIQLLEEQTPLDVPARDELIFNAARTWLMERSRTKRMQRHVNPCVSLVQNQMS